MQMTSTAFKTYTEEHGGRVLLLFLLFLLALYELATAGFTAFAIVCALPLFALFLFLPFHSRLYLFWFLFCVNYLLHLKDLSLPFPMSLPNEMLELALIGFAILDVKNTHFDRLGNPMLIALIVWCGFCTLEVLNDTCGLGINIGAWYTGARMMAFQILYAFIVYSLYISTPNVLTKYLLLWGSFALFAVFWVWKQQNIGFTVAENAWLQTRGRSTHVLQAGTLIRYFSIYSDAANFGIGIASTAVAFIIFGITSKIKKYKYFFLFTGIACVWATFPSGTRTAIACLIAGLFTYIFLSKSFKIAVPFSIAFVLFVFFLAFTNIGNSNQQIRRMRSAFNRDDASANARSMNQAVMKKYLNEAPFGIGLGIGYENVPANNKYHKLATLPPDSEYVFVWQHTGKIGLTFFIITTLVIFLAACYITMFRLKSPSLRGIGAGMCCAFISQQLGGYGNQVLMQFPNCLIFYGGISIVYILPYIESEWTAYENKLLARQEEKKRLKLEKKRAARV